MPPYKRTIDGRLSFKWDVDEAANFWSQALGRAVEADHRVEHESRVHIDIETADLQEN